MFVRNATLNDLEEIKDLFNELNLSSVELLPSFFRIAKTTDEQVKDLINDDNCILMVAEKNNKIIGLVEAYWHTTKDKPVLIKKEYIYIQNLIVSSTFRRQGIGKALLAAVKKEGNERNIKCYRLSVIPNNNSAIEFYKNLGFEDIMYSMEMNIKEQ